MNKILPKIEVQNIIIIIFILIALWIAFFTHTKNYILIYDPISQKASLQNCFVNDPETEWELVEECISKKINILLKNNTTTQLMDYIVATTSPPTIQDRCHAISHVLGKITLNNSKSLYNAIESCTYNCRSGCVHGAVTAAVIRELGVSEEDLSNMSQDAVEIMAKKYCLEDGGFCHAIGHIIFQTFSEYNGSLKMCHSLTVKKFLKEKCYEGVFMESLGANSSLFKNEVSLNINEDYTYPCRGIPSDYRRACIRYLYDFQNILFKKNNIINIEKKITKYIHTCDSFNWQDRLHCLEFLGFYSDRFLENENPLVKNTCSFLTLSRDIDICSLGISNKLLIKDKYVEVFKYCNSLTSTNGKNFCYYSTFQSLKDTSTACAKSLSRIECVSHLEKYLINRDKIPNYYFDIR